MTGRERVGRTRWMGVWAAVGLGMAGTARAATWTWTGNGSSDLWSDVNNWTPTTKPSSHYTTDLIFDGSNRLTPEQDIDRDFQFNSLVFSNNAGPYQIGGATNIQGESGWLNLQFAGSRPSITVLGTNNILIKGTLIARDNELTNLVTVPQGVALHVPWIRGGTGSRVIKLGEGTLRVYEHAEGQRYVATASTVGPRYWIQDGTVEFGCVTDRYVCGSTSYTNWVLSSSQQKCSYTLQVGDGVGAPTSAVVRYVMPVASPNYIPIIEPDGLLDLNGMVALDLISTYNVLTNRGGVVRTGTARILFRSGSRTYLQENGRIEGDPSVWSLSLYGGSSFFADGTGTRAVVRGGSRMFGGGYVTNVVEDKAADDVDFEYDGVLNSHIDASDAVTALRKEGPGTMLIGGAILQGGPGPTQMVVQGTLLLNSGAVVRARLATQTNLWHVYTNATLGGSGVISNAPVMVYSGAIAPGLSGANRSGILTLGSNLTFHGACQLRIDVTGGNAVPGVDYDQLLVKEDCAGLANVDLYVTVTGNPDLSGNELTILDARNSLAGQNFNQVFYSGPGRMDVDNSSGNVVLKFKGLAGTRLILR